MTAKAKRTARTAKVTIIHITARGNYSTTTGGTPVKAVSHAHAKKHKVKSKKVRAASKKRALSMGDLPLCAVEAVAAHRLLTTGQAMTEAEILALFAECGSDDGALIPDVLDAAGATFSPAGDGWGLILGVTMPDGPHAVVSVPEGWLSWGGLIEPCGTVEEAWAVEWPAPLPL